jgi:hypothetical protein
VSVERAQVAGRIGELDSAALAGPLLVVMAFVIASGNAHWLLWSGLFPSLLIPPFLLILTMRDVPSRPSIPVSSVPLLAAMSGMAVIGGASALSRPSHTSVVQWIACYISPLLLYLGCAALPYCRRRASAIWAAITLGALLPLLAGLLAYYTEWGFPNAIEILTSRYSLLRMAGYMDATFGNTANTAALLALLAPAWLALASARGLARSLRWLCALAVLIAVLHALIVESRTLFIVLVVMLLPVAVFHRRFVMGAVGLAFSYALYKVLPLLAEAQQLLQATASAVSRGGGGGGGLSGEYDYSVEERFEAMRIGLRLMRDNLTLGVGPGNSPRWNMYTSAHQYWINQGEEIGLLGFVLSVLLCVVVAWRFAALLVQRRELRAEPAAQLRFAALAGASGYFLYGSIANMPTADTVVNVWIGLAAIMLGMADATFSDPPVTAARQAPVA